MPVPAGVKKHFHFTFSKQKAILPFRASKKGIGL
jgi:hypothetical protein